MKLKILRVLVALGGNAVLQRKEKGTAEEQFANIQHTSKQLVELIKHGFQVSITHGNGPQVGDILLRNELTRSILPPMPLDVCGAESQGMMGYMLQQSLGNELRYAGLKITVASVLTQTLVDKADPAFHNPTKPIGPFYTESEADKLKGENGWIMLNEDGKGYRRVVPSPAPKSILEADVIENLFSLGYLVVHSGGGGIPVIMNDEDGTINGVEAVIDKDLTAGLLASLIKVDVLLMLTDVDKVAINYGKDDERKLDSLTIAESKAYLAQGQFPPGSMGPKVEAAIKFVETSQKRAIIASVDQAREALEGNAGTTVSFH